MVTEIKNEELISRVATTATKRKIKLHQGTGLVIGVGSMSDGTAKKRDPRKWAEAKARARKKMGGHSARAMQLATKYYKDAGVPTKVRNLKTTNYLNGVKKIGRLKKNTKRKRNDLVKD